MLHSFSQTSFEKGDIMVLGVNNNYQNCTSPLDNAKSVIYLVAFKDIINGTTIDFTDNGWERLNANFFGTTEGVYRIIRTGGTLPAGTIIRIGIKSNTGLPQTSIPGWSVSSINGSNSFDIAVQDQFFIMQDGSWNTAGNQQGSYSGNLLLGYNTTTTWNSSMNPPNGVTSQSNLPDELTCYHLTYPSNSPIRRYSGPNTMISQGEWLVRILNSSRWTNEGNCDSFNTNFTLTNIPILTSIPEQEICSGEALDDLEVVDESNVVEYQWYRNTSASTTGATPVGTNSFSYAPPNSLIGTYYYFCEMTINLPLNGTSNTSDCTFISNYFKVTINPQPGTSPILATP